MSKVSWKMQLAHNKELWDIANWNLFSPLELQKSKRQGYRKNIQIISHYLKCQSIAKVATAQGCTRRRIYQLLDKSLSTQSKAPEPLLAKGLIPYARRHEYQRKRDFSSLSEDCGDSGSLNHLFKKLPDLLPNLTTMIEADVADKPYASNVTPKLFFQYFLELLEKYSWPDHKWPWNRERLGQESIRKLYHRLNRQVSAKSVNTAAVMLPTSRHVYRELQIDECTIDIHSSVYFNFGDEVLPFRLSRICLIALIDVDTELILSWLLVFNKHAVKTDILEVLRGIQSPKTPKITSVPELIRVNPAGIIPNSLKSQLPHLQLGQVSLDNALTHLSHCVKDYICDELKGTLHLGRPRVPVARVIVEKVFHDLNVDFTHVSKSTSGSSPVDPIKESSKNAKKPPLVSVTHLEDWIAAFVSLHNARRKDKLRGMNAVERCSYLLTNTWHFHSYLEPQMIIGNTLEFIVNIRVSKDGQYNPRINIFSLTYTAHFLKQPLSQNLNKVKAVVDPDDLRIIKAFYRGEYIGEFWAPTTWQDFAFDYRTRRYIRKLVLKDRVSEKHPLMGYIIYLLENMHVPSCALELYRVLRKITSEGNKKIEHKIHRALKRQSIRIPQTDGKPSHLPMRCNDQSKIKLSIKEVMNEHHEQ